MAVHPKALVPGTVVPLAGQWDGVPLGTDRKPRQVLATRVESPEVEVRPLRTYKVLAEVSST